MPWLRWKFRSRDGDETQACTTYIWDPKKGPFSTEWTIGREVSLAMYDWWKDETGSLYVTVSYEDGEPRPRFVTRYDWANGRSLTEAPSLASGWCFKDVSSHRCRLEPDYHVEVGEQ